MQTRSEGATLEYITRTFVREPDYIARIRAEGETRRAGMQISAFEGHLLAWLVRISGAKNILEIGTFMGVSTLWMASSLPDDGHITSLECDATHSQIAAAHVAVSPHKNSVQIIHSNAHDWLAEMPASPQFDLVFIDAEKKGYADYLQAVLPCMHPRGWIVGDNTLLFGALSGENPDGASAAAIASMTRFNETLADPARFEGLLLPTPEGLTVARLK